MQYVRPFLLTFACILQYVRQPLDDAQRALKKHSKDTQRAQRELTGRSKGVQRAQTASKTRSKDVQRAQRALKGRSKSAKAAPWRAFGAHLELKWNHFGLLVAPWSTKGDLAKNLVFIGKA